MMSEDMLVNWEKIVVEKPVDKIVDQINELVTSGQLSAGDKLPSERVLSAKFNVGRIFVRDAIRKLEFYGLLKTIPQSGTIIVDNNDTAFMGLVANAIRIGKPDYRSLMEARFALEVEAAGLAAERANSRDVKSLERTLDLLKGKVSSGEAGLQADLLFHVQIAQASKNEVMKYLLSYLASHMIDFVKQLDICRDAQNLKAYNEHALIMSHIKDGNVHESREAMRSHLSGLFQFIPESDGMESSTI